MKHIISFVTLATLFAMTAAHQSDQTALTAEVQTQTIKGILDDMKEYYVFPKLADESAKKLNDAMAAGAYAGLDGAAFSKRLTEDLRSVCHDAHLRIFYSAEALPVRAKQAEPSPDEIAANKRFERAVNGGVEKLEVLDGNIGYINLRGFIQRPSAAKPIEAAMRFVANTDALILDLRQNGGGDPSTVQLLCSYFFGEQSVHLNDIYFRPSNHTNEFWTDKRLAGPRYGADRPIYVLTAKRTASGAEECAYDLKNLHRATIVGESTWGGANPGNRFRLNDHFMVFVPMGRAINPYTKTNWEGTGVDPDIHVPSSQALDTARKLAVKRLLEKATFADEKERLQAALESITKSGS